MSQRSPERVDDQSLRDPVVRVQQVVFAFCRGKVHARVPPEHRVLHPRVRLCSDQFDDNHTRRCPRSSQLNMARGLHLPAVRLQQSNLIRFLTQHGMLVATGTRAGPLGVGIG